MASESGNGYNMCITSFLFLCKSLKHNYIFSSGTIVQHSQGCEASVSGLPITSITISLRKDGRGRRKEGKKEGRGEGRVDGKVGRKGGGREGEWGKGGMKGKVRRKVGKMGQRKAGGKS